jgi:hypothetical protein
VQLWGRIPSWIPSCGRFSTGFLLTEQPDRENFASAQTKLTGHVPAMFEHPFSILQGPENANARIAPGI